MKMIKSMILCGALAAMPLGAQSALPTLSDLSGALTNLQMRYAETTNALNETRARLSDATNALARIMLAFNSEMGLRKAMHGDFVSVFETNFVEKTIQRIDVYADGYRHVDKGRTGPYYTPEEMAARIANRKPKKTLDERIADVQAEIARLEHVRDSATNEVEAAHAIISIYQKRRTLERLEASRTNTVTVVIEP